MYASSLKTLIAGLPHRQVLAPLRTRWPGLFGGIFPVDDSRWAVFVVSSVPDVSFTEVAKAVDMLFDDLGIARFVQHKKVESEAYSFFLVEPLSPPVHPARAIL